MCNIRQRLDTVDTSNLSEIDRLGLACCRLQCSIWDEILGPKPDGFDKLPEHSKNGTHSFRQSRTKSRYDYTKPAYDAIESIIGEANTSRCYWKFVLGRSEEAWFRWYTVDRFLSREERTILQTPPRQ